MNILFIGDIVGRIGREAVKQILPSLIKDKEIDFVIANGENLAHGKGMTQKTYQEMIDAGVDYFTSGNHIFSKKDFISELENKKIKVLRPYNYPKGTPGRGCEIVEVGSQKLVILNLMGRVFFAQDLDCPFRAFDEILKEIKGVDSVIVDFHSEATSEIRAFGFHADGKASAVVGTHTHVQTSDEQILDKDTAYISDVGMVGAKDSVLGVDKEIIIEKFLTQLPAHHEIPEEGEVEFNAVLIEIGRNGKAKKIERIREIV